MTFIALQVTAVPGPIWHPVYDARTAPPTGWGFLVVGTALLGVAVLRLRWPLYPRLTDAERRPVLRARRRFLVFAISWAAATGASVLYPHAALRRALARGDYAVVEGVVGRYRPAAFLRRGDAADEQWSVGGHTYRISPHGGPPGFDAVGVVRPGARVRLADHDGWIARVEVAR